MTRLEGALGVTFADRDLLELALTHRSWAFEAGGLPTNERLEFLGDAVLGLVVTDQVYRTLPAAPEGRLAKLRAAAVSTTQLAGIARRLGVGDDVKLGRGEEQSGGREKDSILADTLEGVIGAVYIDQGMEVAADVVRRLFDDLIVDLTQQGASLDYKTALQELTAANSSTVPSYEVTEEGPDHEKRFTAWAVIGGESLGTGTGRSKKEAEQQAARQALAVLASRDVDDQVEAMGRPAAGPGDRRGEVEPPEGMAEGRVRH